MFLTLTAAGTAAAAASLSLGRSVGAFTRTAGAAISELVLPSPAVRAAEIPAEAVLDLDGVEPFITPNDEFYRIDTALAVPELTPEGWSLRIHGLVEEEVTLDMSQLLDLPLEEHHITLTCVSNPSEGISWARRHGWGIRCGSCLLRPGRFRRRIWSSRAQWTASQPQHLWRR